MLVPPEGQPRGKWRRRRETSGQGVGSVYSICSLHAPSASPPGCSFPGIVAILHGPSIPQGGIDPSLAERLLEEASSRAEDLRDENVRLQTRKIIVMQKQLIFAGSGDLEIWPPDGPPVAANRRGE